MKLSKLPLPKIYLLVGLCIPTAIMSGCSGGSSPSVKSTSPIPMGLEKKVDANEAVQREAEASIARIERYLQLKPDGTLTLDLPVAPANTDQKASDLSIEEATATEQALEKLNADVKAGTVRVNKDFSVSKIGITASANENGIQRYWWGNRYALDRNRSDILVRSMRVGAALSALIPADGQVIAAVIALGAELIDWLNRPGRGIYIYHARVPRFLVWVTSQP